MIARKRCAGKCGESKPVTDFHRCSHKPDGRFAMCIPCRREHRKRQRDAKREGHVIPNQQHGHPHADDRPELLEGTCWWPSCFRPSVDGLVTCRYHEVLVDESKYERDDEEAFVAREAVA